jgi:hypothetical protein
VVSCLVHKCVVPRNLKEQIPHLIIKLNDATGKVFCSGLRVTYTNTNPFLVFFFILFLVLLCRFKVQDQDGEFNQDLV